MNTTSPSLKKPEYRFEPISDIDAINSVMMNEEVYKLREGVDKVPKNLKCYQVKPGEFFLGVYIDGSLAGVVNCSFLTASVLNVHVSMLPEYRGQIVVDAGIQFLDGLRQTKKFKKAITMIPDSAKHAKIFVKKLGFIEEGKISDCHLYKGKLESLHIFGVPL